MTATLVEHGTDDPRGWPPRRLRKVRERELTASLPALGVTEHFLVGLTDGSCARADRAAVVAQLVGIIDAVAPDTIVTFGPDGMTGHEDPVHVGCVWTSYSSSRCSAAQRWSP